MLHIKRLIKYIVVISIMYLAACTGPPKPDPIPETYYSSVTFEKAVSELTHNLLLDIREDQKKKEDFGIFSFNDRKISINPIVDESGQAKNIRAGKKRTTVQEGQIEKASDKDIYQLIIEKRNEFKNFDIQMISEQSKPDYVMHGLIRKERYKNKAKNIDEAYYKLNLMIVDSEEISRANREIKIKNDIYLTDLPSETYRVELPEDITNQFKQGQDKPAPLPTDKIVEMAEEDIEKAKIAFSKGQYEEAQKLYENALTLYGEKRQKIFVYKRLYEVHLGTNKNEADNTIFKMLKFIIEKSYDLKMLYLFDLDKYDTPIELPKAAETYADSLFEKLETIFVDNPNYCLNIIGNSSLSGPADINQELSEKRARAIQKKLKKKYPDIKNTATWGIGSEKCCDCDYENDEHSNVIDRRVEFKITTSGCPKRIPEYETCSGIRTVKNKN